MDRVGSRALLSRGLIEAAPMAQSPEVEAELARLREMAEQLKAALATLKKQIDASSPPPPPQLPESPAKAP
jgi:hypothetical protein